jgi:hypothetical protein
MSSFPLRNVLLRAVLVSSTVFSALTLPIVLLKPQPIAIEFPPFFEGEIQPILGSENQNLAIPYIGFSIVMSVGAGMTSVEVSRKWQAARQQKQALVNAVEEGLPIEAIETEAEYVSDYDYVSFAAFDQTFAEAALETDNDIWSNALLEFSAYNDVSGNVLINSSISTNNSIPTNASNSIGNHILDDALRSSAPCLTHQTQVPKLRRRLSSILSKGHYYRLFKARPTKAKAAAIVTGLDQRDDRVVMTETQKGQAIWVWESNAYLSPDLSKVD